MGEKKRRGYATQKQQDAATKRYLATEKGKEARKRTVAKSQTKKFVKEFANLEELEELQVLIKNRIKEEKMSKIVFNGIEYNLYQVKGGDMFLCEDLNMFAWKNRVEYKVDESEYIPSTLEELEKKVEEVNNFFEKKRIQKGWFLISKDDDESNSF
ncbi:MAG: hypothetical protein SOW67_01250 [Fusobacterium necrophorum]|nr:hypothetical protein [Fusobacterium necrophorum]